GRFTQFSACSASYISIVCAASLNRFVPSPPRSPAVLNKQMPVTVWRLGPQSWPLERNWPARPRRPGRRRAVYDSSAEAVMAVEGCDGHQAAASIGVIWTAAARQTG